MALSVVFENWDGEHGGAIYCQCFFSRQEKCDTCRGEKFITIPGPWEHVLERRAQEYLEAVMMIVCALSGDAPFPRCPSDLLSEPAKWVAAFWFLHPYATREIKEHRKRCQPQSP